MNYLWFKAFHIVGVVAWFAGLFYIGRLFVYHREANEQPEPARTILQQQYQLMEKRLYKIIMTPGMVFTVIMAIAMLITAPELLKEPWLHAKLGLVALLVGYHHYCGRLIKQMEQGKFTWGSQQLRGLNEVPTIFLVVIVLLAVFKNQLPTDITAWAVLGMIVAFAAIIQLYARKRRLDQEKQAALNTDVSKMEGSAS
ncbi:protoporphyrinogen oxidase HemJ [Thermocoleostomius sinensis]|jgi:putative membrane protein|uniref:Protoporphyrinogen IX oxidase n=1 Tax=Thermocoleostomius sinensis A174 TaxID=2016057 RepID=A0A9E8ZEJ9_9CYAN|nr:protoporphyrinogen oxidase HemJ [Thermocoleostomius sinensis]WAL61914.1 protoporphyrinogen oxidase HemJ [Thermocoleostomius sinensis A174]